MFDIVNNLKTIIAEELDVNLKPEEIDENVSLFEDGLGFDSIATVELISLIEKHFGIEFSDSELGTESFSSLKVLADFIAQKMESRQTLTAG
ncbi:acyl carrier protein [Scytonema sp. NUACC26]|uniref:acyl carrier protein n=1 Tax=Scytonema sp. NUACC26 TaxID=3140176 RepID=UPI0034DBB482